MAAHKGNKYAIGNSGKEKFFSTPEEMSVAINNYFEECDNRIREVYIKSKQEIEHIKDPKPYTIEGLCVCLGITRDTLLNYEKKEGYEEYFDIVRHAKLKVQQNLIERGLEGSNNPTVTIFVSKNNFGYKEKTEQEITLPDKLKIGYE